MRHRRLRRGGHGRRRGGRRRHRGCRRCRGIQGLGRGCERRGNRSDSHRYRHRLRHCAGMGLLEHRQCRRLQRWQWQGGRRYGHPEGRRRWRRDRSRGKGHRSLRLYGQRRRWCGASLCHRRGTCYIRRVRQRRRIGDLGSTGKSWRPRRQPRLWRWRYARPSLCRRWRWYPNPRCVTGKRQQSRPRRHGCWGRLRKRWRPGWRLRSGLHRQLHLRAAALHLKSQRLARLGRRRQQQVQHLPSDLHMRATIGRRADHLALEHLARLESERPQGAATGSDNQLRQLTGDRHRVCPAAPCGQLV